MTGKWMRAGVMAGVLCALGGGAFGQTYYQASDGTVDFVKDAFVDWTDPANWDTLTDAVAITRANSQGIFNPIQESGYGGGSPLGTKWYFGGTVQDVIDGTLTLASFSNWQSAAGGNPPATVGVNAVLYLEAEDAYVDLVFTDWGMTPGAGGTFAYTRATIPAPATGVALAMVGVMGRRRRR